MTYEVVDKQKLEHQKTETDSDSRYEIYKGQVSENRVHDTAAAIRVDNYSKYIKMYKQTHHNDEILVPDASKDTFHNLNQARCYIVKWKDASADDLAGILDQDSVHLHRIDYSKREVVLRTRYFEFVDRFDIDDGGEEET